MANLSFTPGRRWCTAAINVTITTTTVGASIRYTTDGSAPSSTHGTLYTGGLAISATTVLRAVGYMDNGSLDPTAPETHTYLFLDDVIRQGDTAGYGGMDQTIVDDPVWSTTIRSDLQSVPTVSIAMDNADLFGGNGIYDNASLDGDEWERPCSIEYMVFAGNNVSAGAGTFKVNCGIRIQGGYSRVASLKHSLRLVFKNQYGPGTLDEDLFSDSTVSKFNGLSLHAAFNDHWMWSGGQAQFQRDQWCRDTHTAMGGFGAHGRYVQLYLNGRYWGFYNVAERPDALFGANYLGGPPSDYDVLKTPSGGTGEPEVIDGNTTAWDAMMTTVDNIKNGVIPPAQAMSALSQHLDIADFIDYMLINFYGANEDWPGNNWTVVRRAGGVFHFIVNDAEYTFGIGPCCIGGYRGINEDRTVVGDGNHGDSGYFNGPPAAIYNELRKDPEFNVLFGDRAQRHLFNNGPLTPASVDARWMLRANEMNHAVIPESARWNFGATFNDWQAEQNLLRSATMNGDSEQGWFQYRTGILLGQLRNSGLYPPAGAGREAPTFTPFGGRVATGGSVTVGNPNGSGTVYFTTDGSDPRLAGGGIAGTAQIYSSPILLNGYLLLKARVRNTSGQWSALTVASFNVNQSSLAITEIMYHPPAFGTYDGDEVEFLELGNVGTTPIDLGGLRFIENPDGMTFTFRNGTYLAPFGTAVLMRNPEAFSAKYPGVATYGVYSGKLDNAGETIWLADPVGTFLTVTYDDHAPWPTTPDGSGNSLERASLAGDPSAASSWRASTAIGGSPGVIGPIITITASDPTAAEPESGITDNGAFTVTRSGADNSAALTVFYTVSGTATANSDYTALSGSVTIQPNQASATITVTVLDDSLYEDNETVIATLSTNPNYVVGSAASATVTIYSLLDLGVLPNDISSEGFGINASPQIVGSSDSATGSRAFLSTPDQPLTSANDLHPGVSQLFGSPGQGSSYAWDISDAGKVVGEFKIGSAPVVTKAWYRCIISGGPSYQQLNASGATDNYIRAVVDAGTGYSQGAGYSTVNGYNQFCHWIIYDTTPGSTYVYNIGGRWPSTHSYALGLLQNKLVGYVAYPAGNKGVIWDWNYSSSGPTYLNGGTQTAANDINVFGSYTYVVGYAESSGVRTACRWVYYQYDMYGLTPTLLPKPAGWNHSVAERLNTSNKIVGNYYNPSSPTMSDRRACLWDNGTLVLLNANLPAGSPWVLNSAEKINSANHITGYGTVNGQMHAFRIKP